ncbi:hypothetical protein JOF28_000306 [Leucobacter exalbidus]|uniref:Uncharacterized protein n=1 Tax=Leucobacter exalbidus TaxID=662960 RepID=A0A940PTP3_9MICO|nr:hypothetical protein [Leucobacter exalbidus]MBP1325074.1 hypothetical protein [Leucobacter exalbidus]
MSKLSIDEEMKLAKKAHSEKMRKLKQKQADEEKRITDRVLEILQGDEYEALYKQLYKQSFQELQAQRLERSRKAKESRDGGSIASVIPIVEEALDEAESQY